MIGIWTVSLAGRQFGMLEISERGIYMMNEMQQLGGPHALGVYEWFNNLALPEPVTIYFRSLGAIFFQYHLFAGLLIALGLLYYSRISFLMSLIGFFSAYLFYGLTGANIEELSYYYIGFNFILTAIALGGIFLIPDRTAVLSVILLVPVIAMMITSTAFFFSQFQLSVYSLPFNVVVLMFLYVLRFRTRGVKNPQIVRVQHFSPERNLYAHRNYDQRFHDGLYFSISLPFWGEWVITQGHDGEHTHKNDWKHAWDFEIRDDEGNTFQGAGNQLSDYYCYGKPVVAPSDAMVYDILDGIEDNDIGDMNLEQNWGNTIILKHGEGIFTKLCHLQNASFKVYIGQQVQKGQVLAAAGNSGRSPVPHLHMQIQTTPYIGSKTLEYPLSDFVVYEKNEALLQTYTIPKISQTVSSLPYSKELAGAFHFVPGQIVKGRWIDKEITKDFSWELKSDSLNNQWFYCSKTNSKAYFHHQKGIFYFTYFEGNKSSALFWFYLSSFKIVGGFIKGLRLEEQLPDNILLPKWVNLIQDLCAPFFIFSKASYRLRYLNQKSDISDSVSILESNFDQYAFGRKLISISSTITVQNSSVQNISFSTGCKIQFIYDEYPIS